MSQTTPYNATGRRKTAIAHAWLTEGSGRITINRRGFEEYLPTVQLQNAVLQPFQVTNTMNKFDVNVVPRAAVFTDRWEPFVWRSPVLLFRLMRLPVPSFVNSVF